MRVGFSTLMIQRGQSGVAQHVFALLNALQRQASQHELTVFVLENDLPLFEFLPEHVRRISVCERERPALRNIWWHQARLPRLARDLALDVLHVPSYRRMLWPQPCALVATIHDLAAFHVRGKYDPARMFYGRVVARQLARRQHEIMAVSGSTARDIERFFGIPVAAQHIIWNGIDHHRFRPGDRVLAQTEAVRLWGLEAPFFLYVSRLEHPAKNHVRLIDAFARFKSETRSDWQLALAGGDWHGAAVIRDAARRSPFSKDIRFLGFVDDALLPTLYRAAGAFVYPSLFEGFGLPPVEAMACGCPVLSSNRGALEEVVGDAGLIVDPEDVSALAAGLRHVSQDGPERERLHSAGLKNAARFDWHKNAACVVEVWDKAAQRWKL